MAQSDKAVLRFNSGKVQKGHLIDFAPDSSEVQFKDADSGKIMSFGIDELKAIFFVKSFEGDSEYAEKKTYGISKPKGNRVFIKFNDSESLVGFVEGEVPWEHGFFLSKREKEEEKGFFILPVDEDSNNIKVFVISSSVYDVTVVPQT
jgi:hypothetical protein